MADYRREGVADCEIWLNGFEAGMMRAVLALGRAEDVERHTFAEKVMSHTRPTKWSVSESNKVCRVVSNCLRELTELERSVRECPESNDLAEEMTSRMTDLKPEYEAAVEAFEAHVSLHLTRLDELQRMLRDLYTVEESTAKRSIFDHMESGLKDMVDKL